MWELILIERQLIHGVLENIDKLNIMMIDYYNSTIEKNIIRDYW
jgi:hypothetical protein